MIDLYPQFLAKDMMRGGATLSLDSHRGGRVDTRGLALIAEGGSHDSALRSSYSVFYLFFEEKKKKVVR